MSRNQIVLLIVLALVAALVLALALRSRQAPFLPGDEDHRSSPSAQPCAECHGPDGVLPRSQNHPLGEDCFRCHARE
jgi:cytochrome c553